MNKSKMAAAMVMVAGATLFVGLPAMADDVDDQHKECADAVKDLAKEAAKTAYADAKAEAKNLQSAASEMWNGCAELRGCVKECKNKKKRAKADCSRLTGAKKRACKREARADTKGCKLDCRAELKAGACQNGRNKFWKSIGATPQALPTPLLRA